MTILELSAIAVVILLFCTFAYFYVVVSGDGVDEDMEDMSERPLSWHEKLMRDGDKTIAEKVEDPTSKWRGMGTGPIAPPPEIIVKNHDYL